LRRQGSIDHGSDFSGLPFRTGRFVVFEYLINLLILKAPGAGCAVYRINKFAGSSEADASDYHGGQGYGHGHWASAQETPNQGARCQHKALYFISFCHDRMVNLMGRFSG
jgi:hypothetical protein